MARVRRHVAEAVARVYANEDEQETARRGVRVLKGTASLLDSTTLQVTPADGSAPLTLRAKKILLCTGAAPRMPSFAREVHQVTGGEGEGGADARRRRATPWLGWAVVCSCVLLGWAVVAVVK